MTSVILTGVVRHTIMDSMTDFTVMCLADLLLFAGLCVARFVYHVDGVIEFVTWDDVVNYFTPEGL